MATRYTDEFRRDAVRIAISSGLTRPQVSSDFGVGLSMVDKWVQQGVVAGTPADLLGTQLANDLDIHDAAQIQRAPPPQV
jgi:transposase-like protein